MLAPSDILYSFYEMERKVPLHHLHAIFLEALFCQLFCWRSCKSGVIVMILMLGAVYLQDQIKGTD